MIAIGKCVGAAGVGTDSMGAKNHYIVSKEFSEFGEFMLLLPERFDVLGTVIQESRNVVKLVSTPKGDVVVKRFDGMNLFNRIAYSTIRKSKAERSYINSERLLEADVPVPIPVAWIDRYKSGFLIESYYVSTYEPLKTVYEVSAGQGLLSRKLRKSVAAFALSLHRKGIYHEDFTLGNILVRKIANVYLFMLVDLNRVKFRRVGYRQALNNFVHLDLKEQELNLLIKHYAKLAGKSPRESLRLFWRLRWQESFIYKMKSNLKMRIRQLLMRSRETIINRRARA